jgi:predicted enzyme related to lactoylglutathione lyase
MADTATVAIGEPGWIDLGSPDPAASRSFYAELFGWTADVVPDPQAGGYAMFKLGDKEVAGVGPLMSEQQPPAWMVYVLVEDAAVIAGKVKEAGGAVIAEPFDVMGAGTMGIISDPSGAVIGLWQPGTHHGFELKAVPGSYSWVELNSRDLPAGKQFYRSVFGWSAEEAPGMEYTQFKLGDDLIAGGMAAGPDTPANAPANWLVYFAVADTDATVAKLTELGGGVFHSPEDIPGVGRFAVVHDPQGAVFGLLQNTQTAAS